jgi:hypothetical protein
VPVQINEDPGVAPPGGVGCGPADRRSGGGGRGDDLVDLDARVDIVGERYATPSAWVYDRSICGEFVAIPNANNDSGGAK